jgi:Na+-transporting NADH:ubiquinone oxidoreductase subunit F
MTAILLAILVFTSVVLALVLVLMAARHQLVATGDVAIVINEDEATALQARAGGTLLGALTDARILIPSACGGKGSCGVCDVVVREGGGALMPTETPFIAPGKAKRGYRLACQVKVKGDMRIELAPEIFNAKEWDCRVISNRTVSSFIKELKLALPEGVSVPFRAGGYMQLRCPPHALSFKEFDIAPEHRPDWDKFDLWRFRSVVPEPVERAYSLASFPLERDHLLFTIRIAFPPGYSDEIPPGIVSSWLFNLKEGDPVTATGPFGEFYAKQTQNEMCFIAAGAGMAPMRSHILDQLLRLKSTRKMSFWYSARNLSEAFYVEEFDQLAADHPNFTWHLVLSEPRPEDNWTGPIGLVRQQALKKLYLDHHPAPEDIEYYLCGPAVMNNTMTAMLLDLGVDRENIMFDDFGF